MKDLVSPRQVAQAIDVSESSLKRWCDQGLIPTVRTAGGHRRIPVNGVLSFLRESGYEILHPEILGLPPATQGGQRRKLVDQRQRLVDALISGNEDVCVEIVLNLYLAQVPMSVICDDLLAAAFCEIAQKMGSGDLPLYQERRSCELGYRLMHEIRRALPELPPSAPIAVGGTLEGDPCTLASSMTELVLRELGWRASSLGNMLPVMSLRQALCDMRPKLFWLSISVIRDVEGFLEQYAKLWEVAEQNNVAVIVGGKGLTEDIRRQMRYCAYTETFRHIESFAKRLTPTPQPV